MTQARFAWTEAAVDLLRVWLADRVTAAEIVARFAARGPAPTRSAVIGKAFRLRAGGFSAAAEFGTERAAERAALARAASAPAERHVAWTAVEDAALAALRADGLRDAAIAARLAERFGLAFTARAVYDRARRLGVPAVPRVPGAPGRPTHPRRSEAEGTCEAGPAPRARDRGRPVVAVPPALRPTPKRGRADRGGAVAKPVGIGLLGLRSGLCRWPLWRDGERPRDDGLYCGAAAEPCGIYCPGHARMAYVAPAGLPPAAARDGIGREA